MSRKQFLKQLKMEIEVVLSTQTVIRKEKLIEIIELWLEQINKISLD